jgi:hypothetical protein
MYDTRIGSTMSLNVYSSHQFVPDIDCEQTFPEYEVPLDYGHFPGIKILPKLQNGLTSFVSGLVQEPL